MIVGQAQSSPVEPDLRQLAKFVATKWELPARVSVRKLNVAENITVLVESPSGFKSILRIHRHGYHTDNEIRSELAWSQALRREKVVETPGVIHGTDGYAIQTGRVHGLPETRRMVMFEFAEGVQPNEDDDLTGRFTQLGEIAAKTHLHSMHWNKPTGFNRKAWSLDAILGPTPVWGRWENAPNVTPEIAATLNRLERTIRQRIGGFGVGHDRFGLIHADMRLANLLVDNDETTLIDFDDCGYGWYLYDFASAVSFIETHPELPSLERAWLRGYQTVHRINRDDIKEMETFIMLRRLALLAWIGSHMEATEPQQLAKKFAADTTELADRYLVKFD